MASSGDEQSDKECPLCMEPLELDDINFYPCKCEYQICRFCWHRIRTDENGLCPACRQAYPEDPVNFKPLSAEELQRIKSEKKQKQQQHKQKVSESRKHLANLRVLQKNLVYVVGLSPRIADPEVLRKPEYFGKYGKIHKVVVGAANTAQSSNCTAYVTYIRAEDALKAIQNVNNVSFDGRTVKASLGTTKYCSSYLRNQPCHKPECMYLHDVAEEDASFTKEDMHAGRHTDYEKRLHEIMGSQIQIYRRADSSSSSPKDSGYFDQQLGSGEVIQDENNPESSSHRQSRQHNPPPRHRPKLQHRETSQSSERGQSAEGIRSESLSEFPVSSTSSQPNNDQLDRPLQIPAQSQFTEEQVRRRQLQLAEENGIPVGDAAAVPQHHPGAPQQIPPDWPGRLLAAMQAQVNNQSLFSQDEAVFARQAQAKIAGGAPGQFPHGNANLQNSYPSSMDSFVGGQQQQSSSSAMEHNHRSYTNGLGGEENPQANADLRDVIFGQSTREKFEAAEKARQNHSMMNGLPEGTTPQKIPVKQGSDSLVLSGDGLAVSSQTDWLAAFGLKVNSVSVYQMQDMASSQQPDDDLDFDPFSISAQGLADLLTEEKSEKEKAIRDQKEQQMQKQLSLHFSQANTQAPSSSSYSAPTLESWNVNGGGGNPYFPYSQLSPNPAFNAGMSNGPASTGNSLGSNDGGMLRPSAAGNSPIPHQFTTPPPGFPPGMECQNMVGKMYKNGPMQYPGPGYNGVRQPPTSRHLPPIHSQVGMAAGPHPHFLPQGLGLMPPGAREPSPTHPLPPRGPARSVSPLTPGEAFNLTEWQEGLKNLLPPGVPIKFAPGLGSANGNGTQGPPKSNQSWMGGRHPQPMPGHPFTQPPPPLQVQTSPMGPPPIPRHSPPGGDPYCMPPPPFGGPRPGMPPAYQTGGPWASLTPPPPGFSPRQQSL